MNSVLKICSLTLWLSPLFLILLALLPMDSTTRDSSSTAQPGMVCALKTNFLCLPWFPLCGDTLPPPVLVQNSDLCGSSAALPFPAHVQPDITQPLSNRTCLFNRLVGGESAGQKDCYGRKRREGSGNEWRQCGDEKTGEEERDSSGPCRAECLPTQRMDRPLWEMGGAVQARPLPCSPVGSSQHIWWSLREFVGSCQCAVSSHSVFCGSASLVLACSPAGRIIYGCC